MQVLIDNLSGIGSIDYVPRILFGKETTILRSLNKPTLCTLLVAIGGAYPMPTRGARVQVKDGSGMLLFTGYVIGNTVLQVAGDQEEGPLFTTTISAVSDEILLDATAATTATTLFEQSPQEGWAALAAFSLAAPLPMFLSEQLPSSSRIPVALGARWSETAGALADTTRSAYRCIAQSVQVIPFGQATHRIPISGPGLHFTSLSRTDLHWLADDVTVIGREEPTAYVTEIFEGDGSTTQFTLSEKPYTPIAAEKANLVDLFEGTSLNSRVWVTTDLGGHIALTASGLTCTGGTGREAESTVKSLQQVELGGAVVLEADGVQLSAGSTGTILGFYTGTVSLANCFAGFGVSSAGNVMSVSPIVNGVSSGSSFQPTEGHLYTFRLRAFSPEMERVRQSYFYQAGTGSQSCGGQSVSSSGILEFEVQDVTSGTPAAPIVLFSGPVNMVPSSCVIGLLDSGNLICSLKSVRCAQAGPLWVMTGPSGSSPAIQFSGSALEGAACHITTAGIVEFYPASILGAGSLIYVMYRS